ncbi:DUF4123 domain-containing protein [Marinobacter sp. M3C]|uniref:DUF4123 domain-containing protein n=1 Tax=Marinobacter sp. M3C TaxID=2917715 RepID=UPI00200E0F4B|nr:DUF4123 domain-containing protein [Marinobacter sp. M3C]MCL1481888.1 DUF4123 domain-containing protein [Marinobacter sp.]UQG59479.1 DUF4123 domain-containing protein [Marinobacter sp. M3C]
MNQSCCPLSYSPFDHSPWPDPSAVGLILDGVAIPQLGKHIYQWAGDRPISAECLYAATRWEVMSDLSPWLVWLNGPEDPVLRGFLEQGSMQEHGYLLVSATDRATVSRWMRSHLQIEMAPGCEELMRIAHPALARSVIGNNLTGSGRRVADRLIVPDRISEQWCQVEPPAVRPPTTSAQTKKENALPQLREAFKAFNRRKDALQIWDSLDEPVRRQLGGPQLRDVYPALRKTLDEALDNECNSLRDAMQFLFAALPNLTGGNAATEPAFPMDQG